MTYAAVIVTLRRLANAVETPSRPEGGRTLREIEISALDPGRFRSVLPPDRFEAFESAAEEARDLLAGRVVWNVNSTARGGGVVELLRPLVAYARGAGVDARWAVIDGSPEFFAVTKRIHNRLHGTEGDGGPLDDGARRIYEEVLAENLATFTERVRGGDVVIVHDPQPAGMMPTLRGRVDAVIWRCHVGLDRPNDLAREAWAFLRPWVEGADVCVFSRETFAWEGLDRGRVAVIPPTIDVFTPKNQHLDGRAVRDVLHACGLLVEDAEPAEPETVTFQRQDGTISRVERRAQLVEDEPLRAGTPVVVQVSRWDALKDPLGVIGGFAEHVPPDTGAHLVYAGPAVDTVADDPEGARELSRAIETWKGLPGKARRRIHLASLPMNDADENAIIVNALQRHATVVVQKSLAEGFGLTVAEAMWKGRPVVASRIGGIQDQISDGQSGLLLDDPGDLATFGAAVTSLLNDRPRAERMGERGRERVIDRFLNIRSLLEYLALIRRVLPAECEIERTDSARA